MRLRQTEFDERLRYRTVPIFFLTRRLAVILHRIWVDRCFGSW
jgi:hypothetical protein